MTTLKAVQIASGLSRPVLATAVPGDTSRLFVIEQAGRIRVLNLATRQVRPVPFLELPTSDLSHGNEQGLLGLAFHPKYRENGFFYVNFTDAAGDTHLKRFQVSNGNPEAADPASGASARILP